ncbi:MAG: ATP-binding protein [Bryobacterales bacterium]|nr:ATP-binding protein [Bryobacterales bacterium]
MSLRTRLRLTILALVGAAGLALAALSLHAIVAARLSDALERSLMTAQQIQSLLVRRLGEQPPSLLPPESLEETIVRWNELVRSDRELHRLLVDSMAATRTIYEIQIASGDGEVLASSSPLSVGRRAARFASLAEWTDRGVWQRLPGVLAGRELYEVALPLGIEQDRPPVFEIKVLVHSALLRNSILPQIHRVGLLLGLTLATAIGLAVLVSNLALRPIARIGEAIDRIARGEPFQEPPRETGTGEVAAVHSKLSLLERQFHGAREASEWRSNVEQLLERLEEAVLLFDRHDRLIMAGKAAETVLGRGRWELMGRTLSEVFPPSTAVGAAVHGALEFRRSLRNNLVTLERDDRSPLRVLLSVEPLASFPGHERIGTLVTLSDAETRRSIGSQLDLSTRLAAISQLTRGAAHEIKNPLNAIRVHLEVLKARLGEDPAATPQLGVIEREIERLNNVVQTFLDFTRPVELQLEELDLGEVAREIGLLVGPEAARRGIRVVAEAGPGPVRTRGDRNLLKQALLNVVNNGIEAMTEGGRLTITAERSAGDCVVRVVDQGPGIPPEIRDKIFNLYFTTKQKGSGVGLALTFRIVQLHGGSIDFSSEAGKGTTFVLRFPALEAARREPDPSMARADGESGVAQ